MAIEVTEEQEGKGAEKEINNVVSAEVSGESETVKALQKQIDTLTGIVLGQQKNAESGNGPNDVSKLIELLADKINGTGQDENGQLKFDLVRSEGSVDEDDVLPEEKWVTFVSHKIFYVIVDDKRNGRVSRVPLDKIIFQYVSTKQVKQGRETDLINISTYTCRSKKELEWLYSHSLFNILFFDKPSTAMSSDVERATKMAQHVIRLQGVGQHQLIAMAKGHGIEVGSEINLNTMRAQIATVIVGKEMDANKSFTQNMLLEQQLEADAVQRGVQG